MIPLPKPRGFWDYALFALLLTIGLVFLFWLEATDGVRWADAGLALAVAVVSVLGIILARRNEKAAWIARPTWLTRLLFSLAAFAVMLGAIYADAYVLHRSEFTTRRLSRDMCICVAMAVAIAWSLRRQNDTGRQLR